MLRGIIVFCTVLAAAVAARAQAPASPSVQASPPPVEDYGRLPAMALVRLSPLGDRYAYVTRTEGAGYIIVATTKNEFLTKVPIFKTKVVNLEWAGDDHLIIITSATANMGLGFGVSKSELDGAVSLDLKTPRLVPIFSAPGNVRVAETIVGQYGAALIGDRWYGYFGAYTYSASGQLQSDEDGRLIPDLYRVDLSTGAFSLISKGEPGIDGWLVGRDGWCWRATFTMNRPGLGAWSACFPEAPR